MSGGSTEITVLDMADSVVDIRSDFSMTPRLIKPGRMERATGITLGYVETEHGFPHNGERHPDGDELLILISGRLQVTTDHQNEPTELLPGHACIVPKGAWHKVHVLEPSKFFFATTGPNGEHRPFTAEQMKEWTERMNNSAISGGKSDA